MHQIDLLYMPSITLYGSKYKYILSRYKVARPLRTRQAKDIADMIADICKVGSLTYPKVFQYYNGIEFKAEVPKMLEKYGITTQHAMAKYKHTHMAFLKVLNKLLTEQLFKVQDKQELNDPEKLSSTWVKHLYGMVD